MLCGRGFFRGSSILLSGTPGTVKAITSSNFAQVAAQLVRRVNRKREAPETSDRRDALGPRNRDR